MTKSNRPTTNILELFCYKDDDILLILYWIHLTRDNNFRDIVVRSRTEMRTAMAHKMI